MQIFQKIIPWVSLVLGAVGLYAWYRYTLMQTAKGASALGKAEQEDTDAKQRAATAQAAMTLDINELAKADQAEKQAPQAVAAMTNKEVDDALAQHGLK